MNVYLFLAFVTLALVEVVQCCHRFINIECSSWDYQHKSCGISKPGTYYEIKVQTKYSRSRCTEGKSYGISGNNLWVKHGCRARFNVHICDNYRVVDCDSHSYKYKECAVHMASNVVYVNLASRKSKSGCTKHSTYGINGNKIWVDKGCRARFHVCYVT